MDATSSGLLICGNDFPGWLGLPVRLAPRNPGLRDGRLMGFTDGTRVSWSAPAKRSGDGALGRTMMIEQSIRLVRVKAVSRPTCHRSPRQPQRGDIFVESANQKCFQLRQERNMPPRRGCVLRPWEREKVAKLDEVFGENRRGVLHRFRS